ncbi:MAG: phosphoenolpyruvate carboxylase [SAR202 cluster bacterium]|nr:phosphoenolpyruvate carboxylase [SAR202 cluster bacterium]
MSTQHPDNATPPPFAENGVLKGEGEVAEASYVYDQLGCDEQMWDFEGKAADVDVTLKLLMSHPDFFKKRVLGKDVFLTLRIPNPGVERQMRKKVEEALHTIVTSFDVASSYYEAEIAPITEVILPMTTSSQELIWLDSYYRDVVVGKDRHMLPGGKLVKDWMGEHKPHSIRVIPLFEDHPSMLHADKIVEEYYAFAAKDFPYVRVFLARSDPALNYGMAGAVLLAKFALQRLGKLEKRLGTAIHPIIGVGSSPFRGNFRPPYVGRVLAEFPSVQTYTVQSSFKYDYEMKDARAGVNQLMAHERTDPTHVEEDRTLKLVEKLRGRYEAQVSPLAKMVNSVAPFVPRRRDRRLHTGLFGYSREGVGGSHEIRLPRAITFAAALYSVGVPPELLALDAMSDDDLKYAKEVMPHFEDDLANALEYANEDNVRELLGKDSALLCRRFRRSVDKEHMAMTTLVYDMVRQGLNFSHTRQMVEWSAQIRGFLG